MLTTIKTSINNINTTLEKFSYNQWVMRVVSFAMYLVLVTCCISCFVKPIIFGSFNGWCVTEMMINYEGGFARRGFIGEILYKICCFTHIDPRYFIYPLCYAAFIAVGITIWRIFKKWDIKWWFLVTTFVFLYSFNCIIRKDFIILGIFAFTLLIYRNLNLHPALRLLLTTGICVLLLLIYEPAFFMFMPMLMWIIYKDKTLQNIYLLKFLSLGVIFIFMGLILLSIGSIEKADAIQSSWHQLMPDIIPEKITHSPSIWAISWDVKESLVFNQSVLLPTLNRLSVSQYINFIFIPIILYYILSRYHYFFRTDNNNSLLPNRGVWQILILVQILSLAPLWLGLSCDFARLCMYTTITSYFFAYLLPSEMITDCFPKKLQMKSIALNSKIDQYLPPHFTLLFLLIIIGVPLYGFNPLIFNGPLYVIFNLVHRAFSILI